MSTRTTSSVQPNWGGILIEAVSKPGVISDAYSRFWNFSVGNQLLALFQCLERKIDPGPINTFLRWKELGRSVKKGEKAITLCIPVRCRRKRKPLKDDEESEAIDTQTDVVTRFLYKAHWFVLSQTEGKEYQPMTLPTWEESAALRNLGIERVPFTHTNGNAQGYALAKKIAVSQIAFLPHRTLFHEIAHIVLGHTEELSRMDDDEQTPVNLREVEAECVALICSESLGLDGAVFSRGYIQHWLSGEKIPERSAQRIFKASDAILRAGVVGVLFTAG